ncbi:MAG: WYL domain-containing protein [Alistipes sp.]|nr:WYL domain-containing protein [Flavobacteriales bacterium]MBR5492402.1 WYL domain-containing protein [Alistipes sp.]
MSTARLINKYVWFVSIIHNRGPISLYEIQRKFRNNFDEELSERQFHRYTDAVEELFDIDIEYDRKRNGYVVANDDIEDMKMRKWLIQTFSVNSILHESQDLKNRILIEEVPSGQLYLTHIVDAMRESKTLNVTYHSFWRSEVACYEVEPWCVKLCNQRWYMLGKRKDHNQPRVYALDRIKAIEQSDTTFKLPKTFDAAKFFEDYCGVIIGDDSFKVEPVALKIDADQSNYVRTLPLHHSQVEVERCDEYSIFEYRLCPTFDFQQEILSMGDLVSVLAPVHLRDIICQKAVATANNNASAGMGSGYKFKVYKK